MEITDTDETQNGGVVVSVVGSLSEEDVRHDDRARGVANHRVETNVTPYDPFTLYEDLLTKNGIHLDPHGFRSPLALGQPPSMISKVFLNYLLALRGETRATGSEEVDVGPWRVDSVLRDTYQKFFTDHIDDILADPYLRLNMPSTSPESAIGAAENALFFSEWCPALYVALPIPYKVPTRNAYRPGDKSSFRHDSLLPIAVPASVFARDHEDAMNGPRASTRSVFTSRSIVAVLHARIAEHRDFDTIDAWPALRRLVEMHDDDADDADADADADADRRHARRLIEGVKGSVACTVRNDEHRPGFQVRSPRRPSLTRRRR